MRIIASSGSTCSISMPSEGRGVGVGTGSEFVSTSDPVEEASCKGLESRTICRGVNGWTLNERDVPTHKDAITDTNFIFEKNFECNSLVCFV